MLISLSVIILLIIIGSSVIYKEAFAVVSSIILANTGTASISYPDGFSNENCVVIGYNMKRYNNGRRGTGSVFNSSSYVSGAIPTAIILTESDITINIENINISNGAYPYVATPNGDFEIKIILMKLP